MMAGWDLVALCSCVPGETGRRVCGVFFIRVNFECRAVR